MPYDRSSFPWRRGRCPVAWPAPVIVSFALAGAAIGRQRSPTGTEPHGLRQRWFAEHSGCGEGRPAVWNGTVYFATGDGQVIARDANSGALRWATKVAYEAVRGDRLLARAGVVVAPVAFSTVGLDAVDGTIMWAYSAPVDTLYPGQRRAGYVAGTRIDGDSSMVFVPSWGPSVSAVELRIGRTRWTWGVEPPPRFRSGAVGTRVSGDTVFAALWNFRNETGLESEPWIVALDRNTGHELWRAVLPGYPSSGVSANGAPAVHGNLVLLSARGGYTWAVDRMDQSVVWFRKANTKNATSAEVEVVDDLAFIDGGDENIYALRPVDGTTVWQAPFAGGTIADLLVTDRRVYAANGAQMFVFDRVSGRLVAKQNVPGIFTGTGSAICSAAAFHDGLVFVNTYTGAWSFYEP